MDRLTSNGRMNACPWGCYRCSFVGPVVSRALDLRIGAGTATWLGAGLKLVTWFALPWLCLVTCSATAGLYKVTWLAAVEAAFGHVVCLLSAASEMGSGHVVCYRPCSAWSRGGRVCLSAQSRGSGRGGHVVVDRCLSADHPSAAAADGPGVRGGRGESMAAARRSPSPSLPPADANNRPIPPSPGETSISPDLPVPAEIPAEAPLIR